MLCLHVLDSFCSFSPTSRARLHFIIKMEMQTRVNEKKISEIMQESFAQIEATISPLYVFLFIANNDAKRRGITGDEIR